MSLSWLLRLYHFYDWFTAHFYIFICQTICIKRFLYFNRFLYKVRTNRTKVKSIWLIILADFINVIKYFKRLHYIQNRNLKTRDIETRKIKTQKTKPSFIVGRKNRLMQIRAEQNHDHTRIMDKIQFCSSFKQYVDKIWC